jgi:hypothetical protein
MHDLSLLSSIRKDLQIQGNLRTLIRFSAQCDPENVQLNKDARKELDEALEKNQLWGLIEACTDAIEKANIDHDLKQKILNQMYANPLQVQAKAASKKYFFLFAANIIANILYSGKINKISNFVLFGLFVYNLTYYGDIRNSPKHFQAWIKAIADVLPKLDSNISNTRNIPRKAIADIVPQLDDNISYARNLQRLVD